MFSFGAEHLSVCIFSLFSFKVVLEKLNKILLFTLKCFYINKVSSKKPETFSLNIKSWKNTNIVKKYYITQNSNKSNWISFYSKFDMKQSNQGDIRKSSCHGSFSRLAVLRTVFPKKYLDMVRFVPNLMFVSFDKGWNTYKLIVNQTNIRVNPHVTWILI